MKSTGDARAQRITIRLTNAEKAEIEAMAGQDNRKASDFARLAILDYLRHKKTGQR